MIPILLMTVVAIIFVWSNSQAQTNLQRTHDAQSPSPLCKKGDPLAGVYNPGRFRILEYCKIGSGFVESVTLHDGGQWVNVTLDGASGQNGVIVLEVASQDQAYVTVPSVGRHIEFVGPLVYDVQNHWNAIYPVWSITVS